MFFSLDWKGTWGWWQTVQKERKEKEQEANVRKKNKKEESYVSAKFTNRKKQNMKWAGFKSSTYSFNLTDNLDAIIKWIKRFFQKFNTTDTPLAVQNYPGDFICISEQNFLPQI